MSFKTTLQSLLLILLLAAGMVGQRFNVFDYTAWMDQLQETGQTWWMPAALVGGMVVCYSLALPGTVLMMTSGVIYAPLTATAISVVGGTLGALGAYFTSHRMSVAWTRRAVESPLFRTMQQHTGLLPLSLIRIFPGLPHSVINYSAGILRINLLVFMVSTMAGFSVKAFVYTTATYNATHAETATDTSFMLAAWPLLALVILALLGYFIKKQLRTRAVCDVAAIED